MWPVSGVRRQVSQSHKVVELVGGGSVINRAYPVKLFKGVGEPTEKSGVELEKEEENRRRKKMCGNKVGCLHFVSPKSTNRQTHTHTWTLRLLD